MDPAISGKKRHLALDRAAKVLGIGAPIPSTKADVVLREAYLADLIAGLADNFGELTERLDRLEARVADLKKPPERRPKK